MIPFLTLSFFCGIRVATLERLSWNELQFDEQRVIVPRYKGKNQKRYPVTLIRERPEMAPDRMSERTALFSSRQRR